MLRRPSQADVLRRGLRAVAMLAEQPRRVSDLASELELPERDVQRMLEALREVGLEIACETRWRERWYSIASLPAWMTEALASLATGVLQSAPRPVRSRRR